MNSNENPLYFLTNEIIPEYFEKPEKMNIIFEKLNLFVSINNLFIEIV